MNEKEKQENLETVRQIAREIESVYNGEICKCPHCCDNLKISDFEEKPDSAFEKEFFCPNCKKVLTESEIEENTVSFYDYFSDCLDIEYRIGSRGDFRSVEICIACGGPHIDVDTGSNSVKLYWGGDFAECHFSSDASLEIENVFSETLPEIVR